MAEPLECPVCGDEMERVGLVHKCVDCEHEIVLTDKELEEDDHDTEHDEDDTY